MTDFQDKAKQRCNVCGQKYYPQEGKMCSCWQCRGCSEWYSDFDMLANRELWLCIVCEDERYQVEGPTEEDGPWAEGWNERSGRSKI